MSTTSPLAEFMRGLPDEEVGGTLVALRASIAAPTVMAASGLRRQLAAWIEARLRWGHGAGADAWLVVPQWTVGRMRLGWVERTIVSVRTVREAGACIHIPNLATTNDVSGATSAAELHVTAKSVVETHDTVDGPRAEDDRVQFVMRSQQVPSHQITALITFGTQSRSRLVAELLDPRQRHPAYELDLASMPPEVTGRLRDMAAERLEGREA